MSDACIPPIAGEMVSHYQVLEKIGEGATSIVYKAEDQTLGRPVALKFFTFDGQSDYSAITRLQHEARTTSSLNHPNICTIYEVSEYRGRPLIAMELLDGDILSRVIGGRPMEPYRVIELTIQLADALHAAHAEGIIHRDIKPANIFVTRRDQVKLLDFGLSILAPRIRGHASVDSQWLGTVSGTIPFMSPEQVRGDALDTRTDLFSMGLVLYEMLTGRRPFMGGNLAEIKERLGSLAPIPIPDLGPSAPSELERILRKALEKNRTLRFQTAADIRCDLQRLKRELDSTQDVPIAAVTEHRAASHRSRDSASRRARHVGTPLLTAATIVLVGAGLNEWGPDGVGPGGSIVPPPPLPIDSGIRPLPIPAAPTAVTTQRAIEPRSAAAAPNPGASAAGAEVGAVRNEPSAVEPPNPAAELASWAERELHVAKTKSELKLYDQALDTLRTLVARDAESQTAIRAHFLMAFIHDKQSKVDDAMAAYLEIANRYPKDARAPEALYELAQQTLRSKRAEKEREQEARTILTRAVTQYPDSPWAPRALMARSELEERRKLWTRDEVLATAVPAWLVTARDVVERYGTAPEAERARWMLGHAYASIKRYDLAAQTFTDLAVSVPTTAFDAWFAAGEIYERRLRDRAKASDAYLRVPPISPQFKEARKRAERNLAEK